MARGLRFLVGEEVFGVDGCVTAENKVQEEEELV